MSTLSLGLLAGGACKKQEAPVVVEQQPNAEQQARLTAEKQAREAEEKRKAELAQVESYPLETGEALAPEEPGRGKTRAVWRTGAGDDRILLYVVRGADQTYLLRARRGDKSSAVDRFTMVPDARPHFDVRPLTGGRAVFEYGPVVEKGGKPEHRAILLSFDEKTGEVQVLKRWSGGQKDDRPGWATSGATDLDAVGLAACQAVVQKLAACGKDGAFRKNLFDRSAPDRSALSRWMDARHGDWRKPEAALAQCKEWTGAGYAWSRLSEPKVLGHLSSETDLSCADFGREVADEGGLPRPMAAAAETEGVKRAQGRSPTNR